MASSHLGSSANSFASMNRFQRKYCQRRRVTGSYLGKLRRFARRLSRAPKSRAEWNGVEGTTCTSEPRAGRMSRLTPENETDLLREQCRPALQLGLPGVLWPILSEKEGFAAP